MLAALLAAGLSFAQNTDPPPSGVLEVATLNTWGLPPPLAHGTRSSRLPRISSWIDERAFDLVGLSEVWGGARSLLPGLVAAPRSGGDTGLALRTRLPAGPPRAIHYQEARGFDRLKKKGALFVPISLPEGDLTMVVTHLQASPGRAAAAVRALQVTELLNSLGSEAGPVVLTGDFNFYDSEPDDARSAARLGAAGFSDAMAGSHDATHQIEPERFDRIYVRDGGGLRIVVEEAAVLGGAVTALSDHLPVRARLRVERDERPAPARIEPLRHVRREAAPR